MIRLMKSQEREGGENVRKMKWEENKVKKMSPVVKLAQKEEKQTLPKEAWDG